MISTFATGVGYRVLINYYSILFFSDLIVVTAAIENSTCKPFSKNIGQAHVWATLDY